MTLEEELAALRQRYTEHQAAEARIEAKLAEADLAVAAARHEFTSLRSGMLVILSELDRLDPQPPSVGPPPRKRSGG